MIWLLSLCGVQTTRSHILFWGCTSPPAAAKPCFLLSFLRMLLDGSKPSSFISVFTVKLLYKSQITLQLFIIKLLTSDNYNYSLWIAWRSFSCQIGWTFLDPHSSWPLWGTLSSWPPTPPGYSSPLWTFMTWTQLILPFMSNCSFLASVTDSSSITASLNGSYTLGVCLNQLVRVNC